MSYMIGVDVGGTFTDFSVFDTASGELFHYKHSSTPIDPSQAIVNGIKKILEIKDRKPEEVSYLAHGTTVATNALIEKKGARIGVITTKGFKDLMEIGWQKRPSLYDLLKPKPESLIPPGLKCEVTERVLYDGSAKIPLDDDEVRRVVGFLKSKKVEAIAVCTLFSFINPAHEKRIKAIITEIFPEAYVSISSELIPEFREYSRMSTTVLNAYLGPVMKKYVRNFEQSIKDVGVKTAPYVTQSNGSIISISETIDYPIRTAVSGPSAGVIGAAHIGSLCGVAKIITFDMGGTSADISLIENGQPQLSSERLVEGYPARIPMIDIITIGAGGGSISYIDEGGALKVGPKSAGANPGPACYGRGGKNPTVTDANVILGKLNQKKILGGRMDVFADLAHQAIEEKICRNSSLSLLEAAKGIVSVVNSNMMRAIRVVSVERGYDVRDFSLLAFGGAGPLHACEVSRELGISHIIIPPSPGTLCSLGLLMADTKFDLSRSNIMIACLENLGKINRIFDSMIKEGREMLQRQGIAKERRSFVKFIDARYERQNYEISISIPDCALTEEILAKAINDFHQEHHKNYGYCNENMKVQIINYRLSAIGNIDKPAMKEAVIDPKTPAPAPVEVREVFFEGEKEYLPCKVYRRDDFHPGCALKGPAVIEQMDTTTVVPPGWSIFTDEFLNLQLSDNGGEKA
jgi:N-methylhydantoinase A